uniref:Ribosomal protein S4 n=1 Tax=Cyanidium sp. THAL103 TaxID=3027999 RepID=A0A9Y1MXV3_9RHOD|nr:ribosomal protein S4 [Cyanidium sp. THAL103]
MSKYLGPKLKIVRRLGELPGLTKKIPKKKYMSGEHSNLNKKLSEYAIRLQEKQKLKFNYGLNERQMLNYIKKSRKLKGSTGLSFLQFLEMRLDNIIFRLGMATTIPAARQLVNHGHINVNNKNINIASYQCKIGDIINIKQRNRSKKIIESNMNSLKFSYIPDHLNLNKNNMSAKILKLVEKDSIPFKINELLIVEYYSRKI